MVGAEHDGGDFRQKMFVNFLTMDWAVVNMGEIHRT
jgi:hypothetical protein